MREWPRGAVVASSLALLMVAAASGGPAERAVPVHAAQGGGAGAGSGLEPSRAVDRPAARSAVLPAAEPCTPDKYEPDNDLYNAKSLALGESQRRTLCDEDWILPAYTGGGSVVAFETSDLTGGAATVLERVASYSYFGDAWTIVQTDTSSGEAGSRIVADPDLGYSNYGPYSWLHVRQEGNAYDGEKGYTIASSCVSGCGDPGRVLFVPSVTHAGGMNDTFFRSDLRLLNTSAQPLLVTLLFTPTDTDGRVSRVARDVTVPPEGVTELRDVLGDLFGLDRTFGSLEVRPHGGNVEAAARTYNERPEGSYGVYTPALPVSAAAGATRIAVRELFLTSLVKSDSFRTNLGFCEVTGGRAAVRGTLRDLSGRTLASTTWTLPPWGHKQVNDIFGSLGAPSGVEAWMSLEVIDGSGWILGYATVIDNGTSDAIFVPAQPATSLYDYYYNALAIPAAASTPGAYGAYYRTDLRLLNAAPAAQTFDVTFRPAAGSATPALLSKSFDVPARSVLALDDVVGLFGGTAGGLEVTGKGPERPGPAVVTARTYTGAPGATYGDLTSGVPYRSALTGTAAALVLPPGDDAYRVNAGVLNEINVTSRFALFLIGADGTSLGGSSFVVPASGQLQLNDVLALPGRRPGDVARIEIDPEPGAYPASFHAYAVVIDNRSNDFVYVPAVPSPRPEVTATVTLPGDVQLALRLVRRGVFAQGSPDDEVGRDADETLHEVLLTDDVFVGVTEVTRGQWNALMGSSLPQPSLPVASVSWDAVAGSGGFLEKLNAHLAATGQASVGTFRLPTEAEWERAARAGTSTPYSFYDVADPSCLVGCGTCPSRAEYMVWCGDSTDGPEAVGGKRTNGFGLFDIHGNVWEWVADWYGDYPAELVVDPAGPDTGTQRVIRGGGWNSEPRLCRSANRFAYTPGESYDYVGFRVVASRP